MAWVWTESSGYPEAVSVVFGPPPISGVGAAGGLRIQVVDLAGQGIDALAWASPQVVAEMSQRPELNGLYNTFRASVPQIRVAADFAAYRHCWAGQAKRGGACRPPRG
ncbi:MAG TPA: hypothetical protein VNP04_00375 [Alphaproteobacteria bacterium]|nr:hypothetical protein [Alphaproteobacteria bacterium]